MPASCDIDSVGQQDDFEEDSGVISGRASFVVVVAGVQGRQVQLVIHQVVQSVFEAAGLDLRIEHHRDELRGSVNRLVAGHGNVLLMELPLRFRMNS